MGILVAGLIGQVRNKVGNMVFSNWKGINTARAYAVPANPQSVNQTVQRTKFAAVVALAQNLLGTLITTFVNPFAVKMSGFNMFISMFIENATSEGLATALCEVTRGTLEGVGAVTAEYTTGTGALSISHNPTPNGNGLASDSINLLALDNGTNEVLFYGAGLDTRDAGSFGATLPSGLLAADIVVFVWASRGTGSSFIVSNSSGSVAVAS